MFLLKLRAFTPALVYLLLNLLAISRKCNLQHKAVCDL